MSTIATSPAQRTTSTRRKRRRSSEESQLLGDRSLLGLLGLLLLGLLVSLGIIASNYLGSFELTPTSNQPAAPTAAVSIYARR